MPDRFDNLSIEDMIAQDLAMYREAVPLQTAIRDRMLATCPIKVDHAYIIRPYSDGESRFVMVRFSRSLTGRTMLVRHLTPNRVMTYGRDPEPVWYLAASGPLKRPVANARHCGQLDGKYTSRHEVVLVDRLDPATEQEP